MANRCKHHPAMPCAHLKQLCTRQTEVMDNGFSLRARHSTNQPRLNTAVLQKYNIAIHDALQARYFMRKLQKDGIEARIWSLVPTSDGVTAWETPWPGRSHVMVSE